MNSLVVGVSDCQVSSDPSDCLVTYALGSCIAVAIYDPVSRVGGLLHYMLPESKIDAEKAARNPYMFADTGIPALFHKVYGMGGEKKRLRVMTAGGAQVLESELAQTGKRNQLALKKILWRAGVLAHHEEIGGAQSRTIRMEIESGRVFMKLAGGAEQQLGARGGAEGGVEPTAALPVRRVEAPAKKVLPEKGASVKSVVVGVGDCQVTSDRSSSLITYALGSCIALVIHDPVSHVGGLLHYMLPESKLDGEKAERNPYMFADTGIPALFHKVYGLGGDKKRLRVMAAGGAQVLGSDLFQIGKRNLLALKKILWRAGVLVHHEEVGGEVSRTIRLDVDTGEVFMKLAGGTEQQIGRKGGRQEKEGGS